MDTSLIDATVVLLLTAGADAARATDNPANVESGLLGAATAITSPGVVVIAALNVNVPVVAPAAKFTEPTFVPFCVIGHVTEAVAATSHFAYEPLRPIGNVTASGTMAFITTALAAGTPGK